MYKHGLFACFHRLVFGWVGLESDCIWETETGCIMSLEPLERSPA